MSADDQREQEQERSREQAVLNFASTLGVHVVLAAASDCPEIINVIDDAAADLEEIDVYPRTGDNLEAVKVQFVPSVGDELVIDGALYRVTRVRLHAHHTRTGTPPRPDVDVDRID